MNQEDGGGQPRYPEIHIPPQEITQQDRIGDVQRDVHDVETHRAFAGRQIIQVEREKRQLPQMKWVEEVKPARGVCDIAVFEDQNIIEMEGVVERSAE